jgi:hypothetical protein
MSYTIHGYADVNNQMCYCHITYTDILSVHLGYPTGFRLELSTWFDWTCLYGRFLQTSFQKERNLRNLDELSHIPWSILTTFHIPSSEFYHTQNRHETLKQKNICSFMIYYTPDIHARQSTAVVIWKMVYSDLLLTITKPLLL